MTQHRKITPAPEPDFELDEGSLSAIRAILTEEEAPAPPAALVKDAAEAEHAEVPRASARRQRKADALPRLRQPLPDPEAEVRAARALAPRVAARPSMVSRIASPLLVRLKRTPVRAQAAQEEKPAKRAEGVVAGYRPKPAHIALGAFVLLVIFRPWLVLGVTLLAAFILTGVLLMVGYDGFWQGVIRISRWYAGKRPSRAAAIHARLDGFAMRWDAFLDRFPEGTVDGLYLPDFGALEMAEQRHDEVMQRRLASLNEKGA